jgi:crotonobetainyl-CoA:carnitine CoA-transferase CaiB-like acyl-CoA transferase
MCADREYVMVGAFTREFWRNLCRALDRAAWIEDPRFATNPARLANRDVLIGELEKIFASRVRAEWLEILDGADVPNSPVLELHDAVSSEQARHNRSMLALDEAVQVARCPIRSAEWGEDPAAPAPGLGRDTHEVLHSLLGMDSAEINALAERNVVAFAS